MGGSPAWDGRKEISAVTPSADSRFVSVSSVGLGRAALKMPRNRRALASHPLRQFFGAQLRLLAQDIERPHELQFALHLLIASGNFGIAQAFLRALMKAAHIHPSLMATVV